MTNGVQLPTFSGEPKDFQVWLLRFKAFSCVHGFRAALERVADANLPDEEDSVIDEKTANEKLQIKAKRANDLAMANLMMAFSEGLMGLVHQSMDTKWPNGVAWKVVDGLYKRFVPQDLMSC